MNCNYILGSGFTFSAERNQHYGQRHCQPLLQRPHQKESHRAATSPANTRPRFLVANLPESSPHQTKSTAQTNHHAHTPGPLKKHARGGRRPMQLQQATIAS